jgi:hypothetical protein
MLVRVNSNVARTLVFGRIMSVYLIPSNSLQSKKMHPMVEMLPQCAICLMYSGRTKYTLFYCKVFIFMSKYLSHRHDRELCFLC